MGYAEEVLADTPIGYWKLDETSGGSCADSSGNSLTGAAQGVYQRNKMNPLPREVGKSIKLQGTSGSYVEVAHNALLNVGDVFTLEAWANRMTVATVGAILAKGNSGFYIRIASDNTVEMLKDFVASIVKSTVSVFPDGKFHHIVGTKNGATVKLYVDGVDATGTVTNATIVDTANVMRIGDAVSAENLAAYVGHAAVYGTALSLARVQAHYAAGAGPQYRFPLTDHPHPTVRALQEARA